MRVMTAWNACHIWPFFRTSSLCNLKFFFSSGNTSILQSDWPTFTNSTKFHKTMFFSFWYIKTFYNKLSFVLCHFETVFVQYKYSLKMALWVPKSKFWDHFSIQTSPQNPPKHTLRTRFWNFGGWMCSYWSEKWLFQNLWEFFSIWVP